MERARLCARPDCGALATATLHYQYANRTVWLDDLAVEAEPSGYDLCPRHADRLKVPVGWTTQDRRGAARLPFPQTVAV
jgi:hypothetical protein